jgi:hypothetical protein
VPVAPCLRPQALKEQVRLQQASLALERQTFAAGCSSDVAAAQSELLEELQDAQVSDWMLHCLYFQV